MTLFRMELRKVLSVRLMAVALVICALYIHLFVAQSVRLESKQHPAAEAQAWSHSAARDYGAEIDAQEFAKWQAQFEQLKQDAAEKIAKTPALGTMGFRTWDELMAALDGASDAKSSRIYEALRPAFFSPGDSVLGFQLQSQQHLLEQYGEIATHGWSKLQGADQPSAVEARLKQVVADGTWRSVQDPALTFDGPDYEARLAIAVFLAVLLVVSPMLVSDRVRRMRELQYSTVTGRRLLTTQFFAPITAGFFVSIVVTAAGLVPLARAIEPAMLGNSMSSFLVSYVYRSEWTQGGVVVATAALVVLLGTATSAVAFLLARFSRGFISLIVRLIIAFVLALFLSPYLLGAAFTFSNPLHMLISFPGIETWCAVVFAAICAVSAFAVLRRERSVDCA